MRFKRLGENSRTDPKQQEILDRLFAAYREAFSNIEPSSEFLPAVWARIEASRPANWLLLLRLWTLRVVAGAALATALLLGALGLSTNSTESIDVLEASYIDALTADAQEEYDDLSLLSENGR